MQKTNKTEAIMKTIGRKVLSLLFALALVATMYTPAFSLYETSDVNF